MGFERASLTELRLPGREGQGADLAGVLAVAWEENSMEGKVERRSRHMPRPEG